MILCLSRKFELIFGQCTVVQEVFQVHRRVFLITINLLVYAYIYNQPGKCGWSGKEKHSSSLKMHAWNVYFFNIHNINIKYKLCKAVVYCMNFNQFMRTYMNLAWNWKKTKLEKFAIMKFSFLEIFNDKCFVLKWRMSSWTLSAIEKSFLLIPTRIQ